MKVKQTIKMTGVRKIIADKMRESVTQLPQGTLFSKMNMEPILEYKKILKEENPSVTVTGMLVKLVSKALEKNLSLNSAVIDDEVVIYESINIGVIAESKTKDLFVLVVKDTQEKTVDQISNEIKDMIERLNSGKITMDDLTGATFSLSNLGMFDVDYFTPMLMPPQTGILGVGATKKELVVNDDDSTSIQKRSCFSLTGNHAAIDGAPIARFIGMLKNMVENASEWL